MKAMLQSVALWGLSALVFSGCGTARDATPAAEGRDPDPDSAPRPKAKPDPDPDPAPGTDAPEPAPSTAAPDPDPAPEPAPEASDLKVNLTFIQGERSRDSSQRTVRCRVADRAVTYYGPYGKCERGRCPHKQVAFELSGPDRDGLTQLLTDEGLLDSFSQTQSTTDIGSYVTIKLKTHSGGKSASIDVAGMLSAGAKHQLDEDGKAWKKKVERLRSRCTQLAGAHLPDAH